MSSSTPVLPEVKTVLGLDLARNTGYCLLKLDEKGEFEAYFSSFLVSKSVADNGIQAGRLTGTHILETITVPVDLLVYEGYGFSSGNAIFTLEFSSIVKYLLRDFSTTTILVPPSALKKYVTGKGNAKKTMMPLEVYKRFGLEAKDDDQADAIALAHYGLQWATGMKLVPASHTKDGTSVKVVEYI